MRIGKTLNFSGIFFYIFNLWRLIVLLNNDFMQIELSLI